MVDLFKIVGVVDKRCVRGHGRVLRPSVTMTPDDQRTFHEPRVVATQRLSTIKPPHREPHFPTPPSNPARRLHTAPQKRP